MNLNNLYKKIVEPITGPIYDKVDELVSKIREAADTFTVKAVALEKQIGESADLLRKLGADIAHYRGDLDVLKKDLKKAIESIKATSKVVKNAEVPAAPVATASTPGVYVNESTPAA